MMFMMYLSLIILSFIPMAFFTLLERRVLGSFQLRLGPNMAFMYGIMQPIADALKLFMKGDKNIRFNLKEYWILSPNMAMIFYVFMLIFLPLGGSLLNTSNLFILLICVMSVNVYFLVFGSLFSMSKYSTLGGYRSISQMISYEVVMIFCLITVFYCMGEWKLDHKFNINMNFFLLSFILIWALIVLSEANRMPYDFLEGESELVSGFNIEYGGGFFSFFFIYEYGMILLLSVISSFILFTGIKFFVFFIFLLMIFLWVRVSYPRFRFDFLMEMVWKKIMFLSMSNLMVVL